MVKSVIIRVVVVVVGILAVVFGRSFLYPDGYYEAPQIESPTYTQVATPLEPSTKYTDSFVLSEGTILFDVAHENAFSIEELNVLILRLVTRGLTVDFLSVEDSLEERLLGEQQDSGLGYTTDQSKGNTFEEEEQEAQEEVLEEEDPAESSTEEEEEILEEEEEPLPSAFVIICPQQEFARDDIDSISKFVKDGGKLLLIDDPTRHVLTNMVSYNFGLVFEPDYLYNMVENDANYRNIFITRFEENSTTEKLSKIVLYTAGSISSDNLGIAFSDENTYSSQIETRKELSPIALAEESKVLAIYDLTFLIEPYNGILDNNQLISNIADWLANNTHD
ncbi:hypothetical protein ACFLV5_02055 [Chloroflexota bacterium]